MTTEITITLETAPEEGKDVEQCSSCDRFCNYGHHIVGTPNIGGIQKWKTVVCRDPFCLMEAIAKVSRADIGHYPK